MMLCVLFFRITQIEAQRSGFNLERRSKGAGGWRSFLQKRTPEQSVLCSDVVRVTRFELAAASGAYAALAACGHYYIARGR